MPPSDPPLSSREILGALYTGVVADVLDTLGYRDQSLAGRVRPLTGAAKVAGRVFPARAEPVRACPAEPYKLELAAIEAAQPGDVLVIEAGDDEACSLWGELLTTACQVKGVRGVVMTACTRDVWKIKDLDFPVFGIGYHPADSKGRLDLVAIGAPIQIGGVRAKAGDLILGDEDGVVVIPAEVADETLRLAAQKLSEENVVRDALLRGMPIGEAFRRYGIL